MKHCYKDAPRVEVHGLESLGANWLQNAPIGTQFHGFRFAKSSRKLFGMCGGDDGA
jgi:hypothetical protein